MARRLGWFYVSLTGCLICAASLRALGGESQSVEVRSRHSSVVTDGGETRRREVAIRFEQMRAVFGALWPKANVNLAVPLQIVAFRNTKELRQFAPLWNGKPTQVAGLFQGNSDRSFILLDLSVGGELSGNGREPGRGGVGRSAVMARKLLVESGIQ